MNGVQQFREGPVLVIGGAGVDIVGTVKSELRRGTSNPGQVHVSYGGVARNVAENLARLGQSVSLITVIGKDDTGDRLMQDLIGAGVEVSAVLRSSKHATGSYMAIIDANGELQYALDDMRVLNELTPAFLRDHSELFKQASLLFMDANVPTKTFRTALSLARQAKLPVCADPTSLVLADRLRTFLPRFFLITPNSAEAARLCDPPQQIESREEALHAAKCLVGQGVEIAIITMAELGVCYATTETSGHISAIRTDIIDPTGVGDALTATVIYALLNNIQLDDAVRLAVSAASLKLRHKGTVVPDLSLEKIYDQLVI